MWHPGQGLLGPFPSHTGKGPRDGSQSLALPNNAVRMGRVLSATSGTSLEDRCLCEDSVASEMQRPARQGLPDRCKQWTRTFIEGEASVFPTIETWWDDGRRRTLLYY